ncbi:serine hydrolase [Oceanobacillus rekensis]|uniref:serine hydrolase n=1 Tax=Oceanobacillus rekensis TaxID=937927 RepID=UPI001592E098|nr:serine hydrolase [Oceanobacillus rekensis]
MHLNELETALRALTKEVASKFSIAVHTDEGSIAINVRTPRKAASLAKLFILGEAYQQVEATQISLDKLVYITPKSMVEGSGVITYLTDAHVFSYQNLLELMIIVSDNTASNILLDTIGMEYINHFATKIGCNHTSLQRKFMDQKSHLQGNENVTTSADIICLLKLFSRENDFFSNDSRKQILNTLGNQQFNSKLSTYINDTSIKIYHKTGELHSVEHDAAIMEANGNVLEVAVLTDGWENNGDASKYMAEIGRLLMNYLVS